PPSSSAGATSLRSPPRRAELQEALEELDREPAHVGVLRELQLVPKPVRAGDGDRVADDGELELVEPLARHLAPHDPRVEHCAHDPSLIAPGEPGLRTQ